mmetsp:Transcript_37807/g.106838  ORF Transcript_37807/g.106838 Transcript_37807/m.106838 type:complete len:241 (-) Transcript_37807:266-988(-)
MGRHANASLFRDGDTRITVTQPDGFLLKVEVLAKIDLPPKELYSILTDPERVGIFRNIKGVKFRKVHHDDGYRQKVEVEQITRWKFLLFRGTFNTRVFVQQDSRTCTIDFKLAKKGIMKDFEGSWKLEPYTQRSYDAALQRSSSNLGSPPAQQPPWVGLGTLRLPAFMMGQQQSTLVTLSQSLAPAYAPPPLDRLLTGISVRTVRTILEDLEAEVERVNGQGRGSLHGNASQIVEKSMRK